MNSMSSKVVKWFKRQASIKRFTEKKDDHKSVSSSNEPSDEKRRFSFGRLSFRKKRKRKLSSTAETEGNLAIVGISKKYSYSVPNEMEGGNVLKNGATNTVSLDNSSCTNSPTKTDYTSKSVSEVSYHSSFDNEAHSSEFSREFDNTPLLADTPKTMSEKLELDSDTSKLSDTFHSGLTSPDKSSFEIDTIFHQFLPIEDQSVPENSSNLEFLSPKIDSAESQIHPQDVKIDKTVIPTIVIESVPNKPPLAAIESYSSDDLSCLSEVDIAEMNQECESIISVDEKLNFFIEIDSVVENAKSESNFHCEGETSEEKDGITMDICDSVTSNADNDELSLNSFDKSDDESEETVAINCVNKEFVNLKSLEEQNLNEDTTNPSSCESVSSVINVTELQSLNKDQEIVENGSIITKDNNSIPNSAHENNEFDTKAVSHIGDNLSRGENTDSVNKIHESEIQSSLKNKKNNENTQVEKIAFNSQTKENKKQNSKLTEGNIEEISLQFPEPHKHFSLKTPSKKVVEYPVELNPFGDDSEEESSNMLPSLDQIKENDPNPFRSFKSTDCKKKSEHDASTLYKVNLKKNIPENSESSLSGNSQRKIFSSESTIKKSLNPFGDSDDDDNVNHKGEIPPRLPPKSDLQKQKYNGASLVPVPRPRKTKLHHGSTSSLQNISTFPIPAPRSITPYGSTRTLNESISSMNPFDEDEDDDDPSSCFESQRLGRNTLQLQSASSEGEKTSEDSFPRNGVRSSLPSSTRFRPSKKRQAPLPPGKFVNKPPQSPLPCSVSSTFVGHRKRSSQSPASDITDEIKPRRSKSPSPRRIPPPRPPLPSQ